MINKWYFTKKSSVAGSDSSLIREAILLEHFGVSCQYLVSYVLHLGEIALLVTYITLRKFHILM